MVEYHVLIVEDSPTMRQLISLALKRLRGIRIEEAGNGAEGLVKLAARPFDLIFTDINMPVMDGLKLVSMIRGNEQYRGVPIVVITTECAQEDRERALMLGADEYITKPIQPNRLLDVAKLLLKIS